MFRVREKLMGSVAVALTIGLSVACQLRNEGVARSVSSPSTTEVFPGGGASESPQPMHSLERHDDAHRLVDGRGSPERDDIARETPVRRPREEPDADLVRHGHGKSSRHPGLLFANPGIYDERALYVLKKDEVNIFFTPTGYHLSASTGQHSAYALMLAFVDGETTSLEGEGLLPSKVNSFVGAESTWRSNLSTYRKLVYREVWPGIDVVYEPRPTGLEYSLVVHPGADVNVAQFRYTGVDSVRRSASGELLLETEFGPVSETRPIAFQGPQGQRSYVDVEFIALGDGVFGFELGAYQDDEELVIDPTLLYGTFLGGGNGSVGVGTADAGSAVALADNGDVVVVGTTNSDFPTSPGAYDTSHGGDDDVFITRLSPDGSALQWSTLLGGGGTDSGKDLALDSAGNVMVTGDTASSDFPATAGAYDQDFAGTRDVFISRLSSDGGTLQWSSFLGGSSGDSARGLALDGAGNVTVTGYAQSADFPVSSGAYQQIPGGTIDIFISRISSDGGALQWSTFLGGGGGDYPYDLAIDSSGAVTVTGYTQSVDFPTTVGAYDRTHAGLWDVFVCRLSQDGGTLQWSTLVGGGSWEHGGALALDSAGNATVTGATMSTDFPTTVGAYVTTHGGSYDTFVFRVSSDGAALQWSTFLGGGGVDTGTGVALDSAGVATVTGGTSSPNFPSTAGAYDSSHNGGSDGFVCRLSSDGSTLQWSTFIGGDENDSVGSPVLDGVGNVTLAGATASANYPTSAGAFDRTHGGGVDASVSRISSDGGSLQWSTFLGGASSDLGNAIAVDDTNGVTLVGGTTSTLFPSTAGAYSGTLGGSEDLLVSRLSPGGSTLLWSTFVGGGGSDSGRAVAVDSAGTVTVTGSTTSIDFPTSAGAYDQTYAGGTDVFISRLSSDGSVLEWSTLLGASDWDLGSALCLDSAGNVIVTGETRSIDFPTTAGAYAENHGGAYDVFVSRLSADGGALQWSTFIGSTSGDHGAALALDGAGDVTVTGHTNSANFPTSPGAYNRVHGGPFSYDAFVSRISADGGTLRWSTFVGGGNRDHGRSLAIDDAGDVTVTGYTSSDDFPTTAGAYGQTYDDFADIFVFRLTSDGGSLRWSTLLGGSGNDYGNALALDSAGNVMVTGETSSANFPTTAGAYAENLIGGTDAFISRLSSDGLSLTWSTYLGGVNDDVANAIAKGPGDIYYVAGSTASQSFPITAEAIQSMLGGAYDVFVVAIGTPSSAPAPERLFDFERTPQRQPQFEFASTTGGAAGIHYQIAWDTSPAFVSAVVRDSATHPGFANLSTPADTPPFNSGDVVSFKIQSGAILDSGQTYWWRVRSLDVASGVFGYWSSAHSFTVDDTALMIDWFQSTVEQFTDNDFVISHLRPSTHDVVMSQLLGAAVSAELSATIAVPGSTLLAPHGAYSAGVAEASSPGSNLSAQAEYRAFKISSLPGSTIEGIEIGIDVRKTGARAVTAEVSISGDAGATFSPVYSVAVGATSTYFVLGGPADTWGRAWDTSALNDTQFIVRVALNITGGGSPTLAYLDHVWAKVYSTNTVARTMTSPVITLADFPGGTGWQMAKWTHGGGTGALSVEVLDENGVALGLSSTSTAAAPLGTLNIANINAVIYPTIKLRVTLDDLGSGVSPSLDDWSVSAAIGGNTAPIANAGTAQSVNEGDSVTLDAAASFDAEGDVLTHSWSQVTGQSVTLSDANAVLPTFTAPPVAVPEVLTFSLTVHDGTLDSAASTVDVTVNSMFNNAPVAVVGPNQTINEGAAATLDGVDSSDPNGDALTYLWTQVDGPDVGISGQTIVAPVFTLSQVFVDTVLDFELVVNDGLVDSTIASISVTMLNTVNEAPVGSVGADQNVGEGSGVTVVLSGFATDVNGDALTYLWTQIAGPAVVLTGATTVAPTFTSPTVYGNTSLMFEWVVSDGTDTGLPVSTTVVVSNSINEAPTADAGVAQTVGEGVGVALAGAGNDLNGDPLTYTWSQIGTPTVALSDVSSAAPTFAAPGVSSSTPLTFALIVNDGSEDSAASLVTITVLNDVNEAPTADSGPDQSVTEGAVVTLDGNASDDENGDVLTYAWVQDSGPAVALSQVSSPSPFFTSPMVSSVTNLQFSLVVTDSNNDSSAPSTVTITVNDGSNSIPVALAVATPSAAGEGVIVTLDGAGSSDGDGDPLTYLWSPPSGSGVLLDTPSASSTTFTTPTVFTEQALTFELMVNDGQTDSSVATVSVTIQNSVNEIPVAQMGVDRTVGEATSISLDGTSSNDPNGDALTYAWTQISGPAVFFDDATLPTPGFTTPGVTASTVLVFSLIVHDGTDASQANQVRITVSNTVNEVPTANAGADQVVAEGATTTLNAVGSNDPNGDTLSYQWTQLGEPAVVLSDSTISSPGFSAPIVTSQETLVFQLIVNDGQIDSLPATVSVTVSNNVNEAPIAYAGADQSVAESSTVTLSGLGSSDPNSDALGFSWTQLAGTTVTLSGINDATVTFAAPSVSASEDLIFELIVDDGTDSSVPDTVMVKVANTTNLTPVADAGLAQTVDEGALVILDGSGSSDGDGDVLRYAWTQIAGPSVNLDDASLSAPSFTAPVVGLSVDAVFELVVSDGQVDSAIAEVVVTIINAFNDAPVADAGVSQSVDEDASVLLDASASSDANGDALTYTWVQTGGPVVTLNQAGATRWNFEAPRVPSPSILSFELVASDGDLSSAPSLVNITVNNSINEIPFAAAGSGQSVDEAAAVLLDASASSDPNRDTLTYQWSVTSNPDSLTLVFDDDTSATPTVTSSGTVKDTTVEFSLIVHDGQDESAPALVSVEFLNTVNEAPLADAGVDQWVVPARMVLLDGSRSSDINGDVLDFSWAQDSGQIVALAAADTMTPSFQAPSVEIALQLAFSLTVTDSHGDTSRDQMVIAVAAAAGPPVIVSLPRGIAFVGDAYLYGVDSRVAAAGTQPLSFVLLDGPDGMSVEGATGAVEWTPAQSGTASVTITAANADGSAQQDFTVDVFAKPMITSVPSELFLLGTDYAYDGSHLSGVSQEGAPSESGPAAVGSPPLYWTLEQGPVGMLIERDTGFLRWQPNSVEPVSVTLRVNNAFGSEQQVFEIRRRGDGVPTIEPTANPFAALQVPYLFDEDNRVSIVGVAAAERIVLRVSGGPSNFLVHPVSHAVSWVPDDTGAFDVILTVETPTGVFLSDYAFTVEVQDTAESTPTILATATPQSGQVPLTVVFDASQSSGTHDSAVIGYEWDFGDDSRLNTSEAIVSHVYTRAGRFDSVLTVRDVLGLSGSTGLQIGVSDQDNSPPTAIIVADALEGQDQLTVHFNCLCGDADGELRSILWTFGDGESASTDSPSHTYLQPGRYHARVMVRDSAGLTASDRVEVNILAGDRPAPSVTMFATPSEGERPLRVDFSVQAEVPGQEASFIWSLGGGETQSTTQFSKTYFDAGYYDVAVEMRSRDALGNTLRSFDQRTVFVSSNGLLPPRVVSIPSTFAVVGIPYQYDEDGHPTAQGGRPLVWRLGTRADGVTVNRPDGMEIDLATGALSWVPTMGQVGEHTVTLLAESVAGVGIQNFSITVHATAEAVAPEQGCACGGAPAAVNLMWLLPWGLVRRRKNHSSARSHEMPPSCDAA